MCIVLEKSLIPLVRSNNTRDQDSIGENKKKIEKYFFRSMKLGVL
jgi:hypothetical protein